MSAYVRTPEEERSTKLRSGSSRAEKRLRKRALAKEAARLVCRSSDPGTSLISPAGTPTRCSPSEVSAAVEGVLSPSSRLLEEFDPSEWTTVRRRSTVGRFGSGGVARTAPVGASSGDRRTGAGSVDPSRSLNFGLQRPVGCVGPISVMGPCGASTGGSELATAVARSVSIATSGGSGLRRFLGFLWRGAAAAVSPASMAQGGGGGRGGADQRGGFAGRGGGRFFEAGGPSGYAGGRGGNGAAFFNGGGNFNGAAGFNGDGFANNNAGLRFNPGSGFNARGSYGGAGGGRPRFFNQGRGGLQQGYQGYRGGGGGGYVRRPPVIRPVVPVPVPAVAVASTSAVAPTPPVAGSQQVASQAAVAAIVPVPSRVSADQLGAAVEAAVPKKKKGEKTKCFRCESTEHLLADCSVILCEFCEEPDHGDADCPLLAAPKPQLQMFGFAHEELVIFQLPLSDSYRPKVEDDRLASLAVSGGAMSVDQVVAQMQRLVPKDKFHWEVRVAGDNLFKVQFPSKLELDRLKIFGTCRVPNSTLEMTFDSWSQWVEPLDALPEIWVRVSGIPPKHLGDFLAMWSVGYLLGKTLKVDMKYTRKHGVLRILVGCLNHTKIPPTFPMLIKGALYTLSFHVDGEEGLVPEDVLMADLPNDKDDDDEDLGDDFQDALGRGEKDTGAARVVSAGKSTSSAPGSKGSGIGASDAPVNGVVLSPLVKRLFQAARAEFF